MLYGVFMLMGLVENIEVLRTCLNNKVSVFDKLRKNVCTLAPLDGFTVSSLAVPDDLQLAFGQGTSVMMRSVRRSGLLENKLA